MNSANQTSGHTGYNVSDNGRLLRRYVTIERGVLRILCGWLPEIETWEIKQTIGRHIWDEAEHSNRLYQRLRELRGGQIRADAEPGLAWLLEEALHAPSPAALIAGLYLTIKTHLLAAYRQHIATANYVIDSPTVDRLAEIVRDEERHLVWAQEVVRSLCSDETERATIAAWQEYLARLIAASGGLSNPGALTVEHGLPRPICYRPFQRSGKARRDHRFHILPGYQAYTNLDQMDQVPLRQGMIAQFRLNFSEMWAAELVASIIFDATEMPWEFTYDLARQLWDEVRHCEMGQLRLAELGVGISDYPVAVSEYERCVRMPWIHRFCDLTMMAEAPHIHVRPPRVKRWTQAGDLRSAEFLDYDWSDEIQHVAYGTKWLKYLLKDDVRSLEDLIAECEAMRRQLAQSNPDFQLPGYFFHQEGVS